MQKSGVNKYLLKFAKCKKALRYQEVLFIIKLRYELTILKIANSYLEDMGPIKPHNFTQNIHFS